MKCADDGLALDHGVLCEVVEREERAAFFEIVDELMRHLAVIEVVGVGGDPLERVRQFRLLECFAFAIVGAVALKQSARLWEARQIGVGEFVCLFGGESEAVAREFDGRGHHALEAELSVFLLCVHEAGDGARRCDGAVAEDAGLRNDIALRVLIHGLGCGRAVLFRGSR